MLGNQQLRKRMVGRAYYDIIPAEEAQPGDLIFFQGTYATAGASHVGIYVGGGMMIHCGNPISYASVETSYWQSHFYCYGRIRQEGDTMGAKLEKIGAELEKARAKRAALDVKIKNLEQKYQEEENTEIHDMVHAANLTPDQLAELLRIAAKAAPNPQMLMETVKEDKQNED